MGNATTYAHPSKAAKCFAATLRRSDRVEGEMEPFAQRKHQKIFFSTCIVSPVSDSQGGFWNSGISTDFRERSPWQFRVIGEAFLCAVDSPK
jgi:hypothetical protein